MATTTIPWEDGSGQNIYLTYPSATGDQTVSVSSDANTGAASRSKTITFATSAGSPQKTATLTVVQPGKPYDAIVEWIATDGTPYIDLGIKGNGSTDALYIDFQPTEAINQARLIAANQTNAPCQIYVNGSNKFGYRQQGAWGGPAVPYTVGTDRHTWLCDYLNMNNKIDGVDYAITKTGAGVSSSNLLLVGPYTYNNRYKGKVYACQVYRNGTLIIDLIPVRVGTVGQMFDRVSNTLFNTPTGAFTFGNDVT